MCAVYWNTKQAMRHLVGKCSLIHTCSGLSPVGAYIGNVLDPSDYKTYAKSDPNNDLTVTSSKIIFDTVRQDPWLYLCLDMGVDYFGRDFRHTFDFEITFAQSKSWITLWMLSNIRNRPWQAQQVPGPNYYISLYAVWSTVYGTLTLWFDRRDPTGYIIWKGAELNVHYYATITKVGSLYSLKIYSDPERTDLLKTFELTYTTNLRYIFALTSRYVSGGASISGYIQNLQGV